MKLSEAHKRLDEEYTKLETVQIGFRKGKIPDSIRVAGALIEVTEIAKSESGYFSLPKIREIIEK